MTSPDANLMFDCLKNAFMTFVEEYTKAKGVDEISDAELRAAGEGFNKMCEFTIEEQVKRYQSGKRDGSIRPAPKVERVNITPRERVNITPVPKGEHIRPGNAKRR